MNEDEVICEIKWTVADIKAAFEKQYGHEPTEEQLEECVNNLNTRRLQEYSISCGWDFINDTIF